MIDRIETHNRTIEVDFRFIEKVEDKTKIEVEPVISHKTTPSRELISLAKFKSNIIIWLSIFSGFILMIMIGWVIWHDSTIYGRTLIEILLKSREFAILLISFGAFGCNNLTKFVKGILDITSSA